MPERAILADETPSRARLERFAASARWQHRQESYFASHARRCAACASPERIELHHLSYARLGAETDSDLLVLCEPCHALVHRAYLATRNGTLRQATAKVVKLIHAKGRYAAACELPGGISDRRIREQRRKARKQPRRIDRPHKGALLAEVRTGRRVYTSREWHEHWLRSRRRRRR